MASAWLDSLSEDWISQPRSSESPASIASALSHDAGPKRLEKRRSSTRIPVASGRKHMNQTDHDLSLPLSERSASNNNITLSQRILRRSSKTQRQGVNDEGHEKYRSISLATTGSIQHNTVNYNGLSTSPDKTEAFEEIPEWRRRLLHGEVGYGEQCDLFGPIGLENIFRPPARNVSSGAIQSIELTEPSLASTTHDFAQRTHQLGTQKGFLNRGTIQRREARPMQYKLTELDGDQFSENDLSRGSSFRPVLSTSMKASASAPAPHAMSSTGMGTQEQNRTVSGQSDVRHEDLSPIFIARHETLEGSINYSALDISIAVQSDQENRVRRENFGHTFPQETTQEPSGTSMDDLALLGQFVNVKRGVMSEDDSFQRKLLSPSSLPRIDESAMLQEASVEASTPKQLPDVRWSTNRNADGGDSVEPNSPSLPPVPHPSPLKPEQTPLKAESGSPLKLFGTYNTFTNQMLLRRLSQFEESLPKDPRVETSAGETDSFSHKSLSDSASQTAMDEAYIAASAESSKSQTRQTNDGVDSGEFPRFGEGQLDEFEFSEDISQGSDAGRNENPPDAFFPVQKSLGATESRRSKSSFGPESPPFENNKAISLRTSLQPERLRGNSRPTTQSSQESNASKQSEDAETPRKRYGDAESKRLPKSPLKVSTPKRRRTLHKSDISHEMQATEIRSVTESHQQLQSVIGRKRKDAKNGDSQQHAEPQVMAARQILRPRTHASSHRSNVDPHSVPKRTSIHLSNRPGKDNHNSPALDASLQSEESGHISISVTHGPAIVDGSRKGSVTTQDFLDEAKKIMAGIRGKARPGTGLNSVEESELDNDEDNPEVRSVSGHDIEDSYDESTKEPFSRPPSREGGGGPLPRVPPKQDDPTVLNYLKKYEELSEIDGIIASSMKSISLGGKNPNTVNHTKSAVHETTRPASFSAHSDAEFVSDPPNIQITENPDIQRKRKYPTSSRAVAADDVEDVAYPSNGSDGDGQSTGRSIPTGSSRVSDSRGMILPPTISHLIPEELAGMVFDRDRNVWVKRKDENDDRKGRKSLVSNISDEDPFGDIPDLTVDETQEMLRMAQTTIPAETEKEEADSRSSEGEADHIIRGVDTLSGSIQDAKGSSSWKQSSTDSAAGSKGMPDQATPQKTGASISEVSEAQDIEELVEEEISIHQSRFHSVTTSRRRPNVTISFSSPLASIIPESNFDRSVEEEGVDAEASELLDQQKVLEVESKAVATLFQGDLRKGQEKKNSSQRSLGRCLSVGGHSFVPRPVSRIDEQDEGSCFDAQHTNENRRSVSLVVSTPLPTNRASTAIATISPQGMLIKEDSIYKLSPLSDFTMNQSDDSFALEVSYIRQKRPNSNGTRTLSISVKHLVQKITDVEPYEPFWEHMKQLNLKGKKLQTLHMLDKFCGHLEELDASENDIQQLDGAPQTIRHLQISHNSLTDLTSWHQFQNLQYVDVSNNGLTSLAGFKSLVHLRGLRADNNKIQSLDGVLFLDGLMSLRLRNNIVEELDLKDSGLQRLTELDLKNNCIRSIRHVEQLRSLMTLNLEDNELQSFAQEGSEFFWSLKYLRLGGNQLDHLDVSRFPGLRLLYLDRNRLGLVIGLLRAKHLDSLSMREQQPGCVLDTAFLDEAFELRKLFLSGNLLSEIHPRVDFLNLQYLELANCGLESLPSDLGQLMPNVRVLNLNFNAIQDIKPLLGMIRLKRLHLAGNRVTRLRKTTSILSQFPNISKVDLRNNPLTLGFYPPLSEKRLVVHVNGTPEPELIDLFTLENADHEEDKAYASRLDLATKMRRRVYEILIYSGCARLKVLDGLSVDRASTDIKDTVWKELLKAEIVVGPCSEKKCRDGE